MASKRRFKGCQSEDLCGHRHLEKQLHLEEEEQLPDVVGVVVKSDLAKFGRCKLVFSQYELLRRIFAFLSTPDLFRASLGKTLQAGSNIRSDVFPLPVTPDNTYIIK